MYKLSKTDYGGEAEGVVEGVEGEGDRLHEREMGKKVSQAPSMFFTSAIIFHPRLIRVYRKL